MRKLKFFIPVALLAFAVLTSCEKKEAYEGDDKQHITDVNDIPLTDDEKLSLYGNLVKYASKDIYTGSGITMSDYTDKPDYRELVNRNFNAVTLGYEMKHGAMVTSSGSLNFIKVDNFVSMLPDSIDLYGHTLAWHQNQNATYLNGLIAPTPIPDPIGTNLFNVSVLKDGSFTGWTKQNNAAGITTAAGKGLQSTDPAVQFVNGTGSEYYSTQLISPAITVDPAGTYVLSFYIKGSAAGKVRVSFDGLSNNYPWLDWLNTGSASGDFTTDGTWQHVQVTLPTPTAATFKVQFDMGKTPNVTYWIDANYMELVNMNSTPPVPPGPKHTNLVSVGVFGSYPEGGDPYPAWNSWGGTASKSREVSADGQGYNNRGKALIIHSEGGTAGYSVQAQTTYTAALVNGHDYHVEAWMKSTVSAGEVQFSIAASDQYGPIETLGTAWKKIQWNFTATADNHTKLLFNVGKVPADYYIDSVLVYDVTLEGGAGTVTPTYTNLISNPDFERDDLPGNNHYKLGDWNSYGDNSPGRDRSNAEHHTGAYSMKLTNPTSSSGYKAQAIIPLTFIDGHEYHAEAWVKSSVAGGKLQMFNQDNGYSKAHYGNVETVGTEWKKIEFDFSSTVTAVRFGFQFGEVAADYYIDDVVVYDKTAGVTAARAKARAASFRMSAQSIRPQAAIRPYGGSIEKTPEQKTQIIGAALQDWISKMVGHYKDRVNAWDALNEPIADNGQVRNANNTPVGASDTFVWQTYLGKSFGVKAFQYAQAAGNDTDILFANDYNLEQSTAKLQAFLDYVEYIDDSLATLGLRPVDGLGTQMHVSINTDTLAIDNMFVKMAATGKLIKVSELDVKVGTTTPSPAQLAAQMKMYRYVITSFMKHVPAAQRYGVTIWGVNDGANENWLADDAPCMWDKKFNRKQAYKGAADGFAGRDIGKDFKYEDLKKKEQE